MIAKDLDVADIVFLNHIEWEEVSRTSRGICKPTIVHNECTRKYYASANKSCTGMKESSPKIIRPFSKEALKQLEQLKNIL